MKGSGCGIIPVSGKTLFNFSNTSSTQERNAHTLLKQQIDEWLLMQSFDRFLKSQDCQDLHTSHSNNSSVKKYSDDSGESWNLIEVFRVNLNRKPRSHTSWNLSEWFSKTFFVGTYKGSVFSCALVGLQLLVMDKNYSIPSFITFTMVWKWTYHRKYHIPKNQEAKDSKEYSTLTWDGICSCKQKTWLSIWFSFTSLKMSDVLTLNPYQRQQFQGWAQVAQEITCSSLMWVLGSLWENVKSY